MGCMKKTRVGVRQRDPAVPAHPLRGPGPQRRLCLLPEAGAEELRGCSEALR